MIVYSHFVCGCRFLTKFIMLISVTVVPISTFCTRMPNRFTAIIIVKPIRITSGQREQNNALN